MSFAKSVPFENGLGMEENMIRKHLKKAGAFLATSVMVLTLFSPFSANIEVHAQEKQFPTKAQFVTVDELKTFNTNDYDGERNPAKIYFGNDNQQWWIVGSQQEKGLTLFAASQLTAQPFEEDYILGSVDSKTYDSSYNCAYPNVDPTEIYVNHYGASSIRNKVLKNLEISYFTGAEQALMNTTTIYTDDLKNDTYYSTTDKLYLAYGEDDIPAIYDKHYITVGTNSSDSLNNGLHIDNDYWSDNGYIWLRTPEPSSKEYPYDDLTAVGYSYHLTGTSVDTMLNIVPAFELNLASVLFGSTASYATSDGQQNTNDAFTLRYKADNLGSAQVSYDKSKVNLANVSNGVYLVAQNKNGAYAKIVNGITSVSAADMGLESFENCKVWLETTDTANRMTYATLATEGSYTVNVSLAEGMKAVSGSLTQKTDKNQPMETIVIKADEGYMFPADYIVAEQNGIIVTRDNENQITVSGTPTADVDITLTPATKKVYSMTLDGNGTFTGICVGYEPITANEFTITNTGNVDLENVNVSITGSGADKFELSWDKTTTIQPNGTIKVTVKPKDDLTVGAYKATLSVSADNATEQSIDLQFTVRENKNNTTSNTDKPDAAVQTGDTTNILLWSIAAVISLVGVITALFFKRRKSR